MSDRNDKYNKDKGKENGNGDVRTPLKEWKNDDQEINGIKYNGKKENGLVQDNNGKSKDKGRMQRLQNGQPTRKRITCKAKTRRRV